MFKKILILLISAALSSPALFAAEETDSLEYEMTEVEVASNRAQKSTPIAFTNLSREQISAKITDRDMPFILQSTPSVVTTSDAGTGIGYTSMRVRGTDATRINVTANGIPINDAESHSLYWVNMPDLASSVNSIQVQRGVGTSTVGAGAFGASVNLLTGALSSEPYLQLSGDYGSYKSNREMIHVGSGKFLNHWTFDLRLSHIGSDGYIERASSRLKSIYSQLSYADDSNLFKFIVFGGHEKTYLAWNYATRKEMEKYGRRYNPCGYMYTDENGVQHFYDNQTDHYTQFNYQAHFTHRFSSSLSLKAAAHFTKGDGYYQEYKRNRYLVEYRLSNDYDAKADLIRRKSMDNGFGGGLFSLDYNTDNYNLSIGGALNHYVGDHFGNVLWAKDYLPEGSDYEYYRNTGKKTDGSVFARGEWRPVDGINLFADMQYRHINYKINGPTDKYDWSTLDFQQMNVNDNFDFFNPKAGLSWQINKKNRVYASIGVAHKEPTRNNYTDGHLSQSPRAESLIDYEAGYSVGGSWFNVGANIYFMNYKDQLVLTGELNEIGEPLADNMPSSYRAGIELTGALRFGDFEWNAAATFSRNKIRDFVEVLYENESPSGDKIITPLGDTNIAFSPNVVINNSFAYSWKGFRASLASHYVSKQYMSNMDCPDHILDAYFFSDFDITYKFNLRFMKDAEIGATVFNVFNAKYETNGYAGSGFYYDDGKPVRYNYAGYAAQAPANFIIHLTFRIF
ncbi:MAG: TonB-dependent receptor [Muribaculaceae bacterium]|nr:TonB-dependent receptor [Muribaculaceae bacterium]